jgi:hypothetical protein
MVVGGVGLVCWYIDYSLLPTLQKRWQELLDAIRGRRQSSSEDEKERERQQEEVELQQEYERQIEAAHQKSQFKHIPGQPWGDPSSYAKASTPDELERAREALHKREAEKREREAAEKRKREAEANRSHWIH